MIRGAWISVSMLLGMSSGMYANNITLGDLTYGGSGCPSGSVSATLSPDAKTMSILFDEFSATSGGSSGKSFETKSCNMAIPVKVPAGLSVSVYKFDYRGFNFLSAGTNSSFNTEYFFAGKKGPSIKRTFKGELSEDFLVTDTLENQPVWSGCGQSVIMRVNTSIQSASPNMSEAQISLDSIDAESKLIYHFDWKQCWEGFQCPTGKINTGFSCIDANTRTNYIYNRLYRTFLQREADQGGLEYWDKNGAPRCSDLIQQFIRGAKYSTGDSTEKHYSDQDFIRQLYRALLEREPDQEGFNHWVNSLQHLTREEAVWHFSQADETLRVCKRYGM